MRPGALEERLHREPRCRMGSQRTEQLGPDEVLASLDDVALVDRHPGTDRVHQERVHHLLESRCLEEGPALPDVLRGCLPVAAGHGNARSGSHGDHRRRDRPSRDGLGVQAIRHLGRALQQVRRRQEPERSGAPRAVRALLCDGQLRVREHVLRTAPVHDGPEACPLRFERGRAIARVPVEGGVLREVGHGIGGIRPSIEQVDPGRDHGKWWVPLEDGGGEILQPAVERRRLAAVERGHESRQHQQRRVVHVAAVHRVPDGAVGVARRGEPRCRAAVHLGRRPGLAPLELGREEVTQQGVVPIRRRYPTEILDQEVAGGEQPEPLLAAGHAA